MREILTKQVSPMTPGERRLSRFLLLCEDIVKVPLFRCQRCGECVLSSTAYVCCQNCPKKLRNGPCGGTGDDGSCEVYPERKCVWYTIYYRSRLLSRLSLLYKFIRIHNYNLDHTSSWLSVFRKRIAPPIFFVRNDAQKVKALISRDAQRKD